MQCFDEVLSQRVESVAINFTFFFFQINLQNLATWAHNGLLMYRYIWMLTDKLPLGSNLTSEGNWVHVMWFVVGHPVKPLNLFGDTMIVSDSPVLQECSNVEFPSLFMQEENSCWAVGKLNIIISIDSPTLLKKWRLSVAKKENFPISKEIDFGPKGESWE